MKSDRDPVDRVPRVSASAHFGHAGSGPSVRQRLGWALVLVSTAATVLIMSLSSAAMAWLRVVCQPLSEAMSWLEGRDSILDLDHVAMFAVLALVWGLAAWAVRKRWLLLLLPVLAIATEVLQFVVPGRTPRLADVRDDLVGVALGWGVALLLIGIGRAFRRLASRESVQR